MYCKECGTNLTGFEELARAWVAMGSQLRMAAIQSRLTEWEIRLIFTGHDDFELSLA